MNDCPLRYYRSAHSSVFLKFKQFNCSCSFRGGLSFEFKTLARNGILFFSASDTQKDFIGCYLEDGNVNFAFDTGSGIVLFKTDNVVNDGTWKKVLYCAYNCKLTG